MKAAPAEIRGYLAALGEESTLALIEAHAGVRFYVPRNPRGSKLAEEIGEGSAAALCAAFGGGYIEVPAVKQWRVALYDKRQIPVSEIARRVGLSERSIYRILGRVSRPGDRRQSELFRL